MKQIILIIMFLITTNLFPQQWTKYTLTSGYVDKNPSFAKKYFTFNEFTFKNYELMVFERHSGGFSQIFAAKIGLNGIIGSINQITNNSSLKRNPTVGYGIQSMNWNGTAIINGLSIWEDNRNGRWDLYASSYDTVSGWGAPYRFDTTIVNKSSAKIIGRDSCIFTIVYEKNGDIIFRQFNSKTKVILLDTNITANEPAICTNPEVVFQISSPSTCYVSYEKTKPDSNKAIYYRKKTGSTWSNPDTIAYLGNNRNNGFASEFASTIHGVFESNRTGTYKIYHTKISPSIGPQALVFSQPLINANYSSYQYYLYPIITRTIYSQVSTYLRKTDSTKLFISTFNYPYTDSTTLGNNSIQQKQCLNLGIYYNGLILTWVVYTKDSLGFSNIYGKRALIELGAINKIGSEIPDKFSLHQNYPNPFNPVTKIKFDIPAKTVGQTFLSVYDILGKEIATLVNEQLTSGTYETNWNASNYPSGIYFYQLSINSELLATRKMMLIK